MNMALKMLFGVSLFIWFCSYSFAMEPDNYIYDYNKLIKIVKPIKTTNYDCYWLSTKHIEYDVDIDNKQQILQSIKNNEEIDVKEHLSISIIYPIFYCDF